MNGGGHKNGMPSWNRGLTKDTDSRVLNNSINSKYALRFRKGKPHTIESKLKISIARSINNKGGRSKWYEVDGRKVQGTYERDLALFFETKGICWIKPTTSNHSFTYEMDGKIKTYTPDFYLYENDQYVEVKGYWWGNDRQKMNIIITNFPFVNIRIIERVELYKILRGELVW